MRYSGFWFLKRRVGKLSRRTGNSRSADLRKNERTPFQMAPRSAKWFEFDREKVGKEVVRTPGNFSRWKGLCGRIDKEGVKFRVSKFLCYLRRERGSNRQRKMLTGNFEYRARSKRLSRRISRDERIISQERTLATESKETSIVSLSSRINSSL